MESSSNNPDSPRTHKYNTRFKKQPNRNYYNEDTSSENSDNDTGIDILEYRKILANLFPSKYINKKVKHTNQLKKIITSKINKNAFIDNYSTNVIISSSAAKKFNTKKTTYNKKKDEEEEEKEDKDYEYNSIEEEDDNDSEDDDSEDDDSEDDDSEDDDSEDDDSEDDDSEDDDSEQDDSEQDDSEQDDSEQDDSEQDDSENNESKKSSNLQNLTRKLMDDEKSNIIINELVKIANDKKSKKNKIINKKELEKKKQIDINVKKFKKLIMEKDNFNDIKFFRNNIELNNQETLISELKQINEISNVDKPYRIILLESTIPHIFKTTALKKLSIMENMDPSIGEYFKLKNWIDTFMRIPFNKYNNLPFNIDDGTEKCNDYMEKSIATLDSAVYGLHDAKMQIMQLIGQWIVNPYAMGSAIAIKGPMGTGKTTLVKEGISKILNRPFALLALGGATDSSTLEGHGYTYEGSTWGKIVDILIQTKCANPIIYFDELDKVSDTPKGEEIIGILTHLIDSTQNSNFHDKYFSEIDFDLSKALFIFSYNDESKVNPILLDRMYKIATKGYDSKEKKIIVKNYLLPTICKQIKFEIENVVIADDTLEYIIEKYTAKEDGVRNLKRCLEIIYTKLNLFRLMKPESRLFKEEKSLEVNFPFTVTTEIVEKLLKINNEEKNDNWKRLYN